MKKLIYIMLFLLYKGAYAQNANAILFTENGEKFTAILNGLRQNETPQTNVKITGLNANWYKLKVIFDDKNLGEKAFNMGAEPGMETSFSIKKNGKGEYVLRPISQVAIAEAPPTPKEQTVVTYNANAEPAAESQTVTQQTTTTTTGTSDNVNVSMGINMGADGGNINMNMSGMDPNATTHSTTTTTTTVSHSSTTTNDTPPSAPPPSYLAGYTGAIGCPMPISPQEFSDIKESVSSKSFEDTKLTIAKQVTGNSCLLASQVREMMKLFDFEATRLTYAKFAYRHTYDIGNFYKVNDAFDFESSIDDLNKYIKGQ